MSAILRGSTGLTRESAKLNRVEPRSYLRRSRRGTHRSATAAAACASRANPYVMGSGPGRTNHYGSRSERGTEVAAQFYSLIESAKLAGVEPDTYLRAASRAALRSEVVPLPHETMSMLRFTDAQGGPRV